MMNGYNYDSITNTLTVSAAFLRKAGVLNSPEYKTIKQFRTDYPSITIKKAVSVVKKNAEYHIKMTHMEEVLRLLDISNWKEADCRSDYKSTEKSSRGGQCQSAGQGLTAHLSSYLCSFATEEWHRFVHAIAFDGA